MKRRNFLKSCLGGLCFPIVVTAKNKPKAKKIKMYVSSSKTNRPGVDKLGCIRVTYTGKKEISGGELMVWQEDGSVCTAGEVFAGVAK